MGVETLIQVTVDKYLLKCVNNYEKLLGFFSAMSVVKGHWSNIH